MKCTNNNAEGVHTSLLVEHEAAGRIRPREGDSAIAPLCFCDPILQSALIERVGRELAQAGMHAVLNLQGCFAHVRHGTVAWFVASRPW
jgi:hypothetical protein